MKIIFEDGELLGMNSVPFPVNHKIDAKFGFSDCLEKLENIKRFYSDAYVYTNFIGAFSSIYAWNDTIGAPEIYIRAGENSTFTRIDQLTTRELRKGHNLAKMWISGEFTT